MIRRSRQAALVALFAFAGCGGSDDETEPPPESSYTGVPADYRGPGVLLVVTWAEWASLWPLLRAEVEQYRATAPANVDFLYANAEEYPDFVRQLGEAIVPAVMIVKDGRTVGVLPNVTPADTLRARVAQWLPGGAPAGLPSVPVDTTAGAVPASPGAARADTTPATPVDTTAARPRG